MKFHYFSLFLILIILKISTINGFSSQGNVVKKSLIPLRPEDLLSFGHYQKTCPNAEAIISQKVAAWVKKDPTLAPAIIRLHFHDCAIRVIILITQSLFKFDNVFSTLLSLNAS